jgi:cadmium resistance protein CadD (predicted permease)
VVDPSGLGLDWLAGPLAFLLTDLDDLVVLMALFADGRVRPRDVVIGQYAGIVALLGASALAWFARLLVPAPVIGLLGLVPAALGIRELVEALRDRRRRAPGGAADDAALPAAPATGPRPGILGVALVTVANGGDNVSVYAPLFASSPPARVAGLAAIFLAMTGLWLAVAWFAVRNPLSGRLLRRWGRWLLPPVLVLLGAWIVLENGTHAWLVGLAGKIFGGG